MKSKIFLFLFFLIVGFLIGFVSRLGIDTRAPEQKIVELALQGRMGNLMFQYAAAYAYAHDHHKELYVSGDLSELERAFGLRVNYSTKNVKVYQNLSYSEKQKYNLVEQHFNSYNSSFKQNNLSLIWGFFQDPRFFEKYQKEIQRIFSFNEELTPQNKKLVKKIKKENSVSIHIRRGDYMFHKFFYPLMSEAYYKRAADYIAERFPKPHFYIFSDDIKWARENIHLTYPHTFVDHNHGDKNYNDMRLMSECKHNIIANSSFSWWGAWLNKNPNKIVIMPDVWLNDGGEWVKNIKPKDWVQL